MAWTGRRPCQWTQKSGKSFHWSRDANRTLLTWSPRKGVDDALVPRGRVHCRQRVHVPDFDGAIEGRSGQEAGVGRLEFAVKDGFDVALGTQQEKSQRLREIHIINKQTMMYNQVEPYTVAFN